MKSNICEGVDDKEIRSSFPSRMKRKVALSFTTDGSLKVKRSIIVFTSQTPRNKEGAWRSHTTFEESQREDSNFVYDSGR